MNLKFLTRTQHEEAHRLAPMPQHTRSHCGFCSHQATCKYKAKFERLRQELAPLDVNCKYYEEWSGYYVK